MNRSTRRDPIWLAASAAVLATVVSGCGGETSLIGGRAPSLSSFFWTRAQESVPPAHERLLVASFDLAGHQTDTGQMFGAWDGDPGDRTQYCRVRLVESEREGQQGYGLMLDYDVDSVNPAYNGFWMKLPNVPVHAYEALSFSIKGDAERGFTRRLKLELKDRSYVARFLLEGIEADWKRFRIPLREFDGIRQLRQALEFVIVFEDETVTERTGILYVDNIVFEPGA